MVPGSGSGRACSNERPCSSVKALSLSGLQVLDSFNSMLDGIWKHLLPDVARRKDRPKDEGTMALVT